MRNFYSFYKALTIAVLAAVVFSCGGGSSNGKSAKAENDSGQNTFQTSDFTVKIAKDGTVTAKDPSDSYTGKFISGRDLQNNRITSDTYVQFQKKGADGYIVRKLVNIKTQQTIVDWPADFYEFYIYPDANVKLAGGKIATDVICAGRLDKTKAVLGGSEIWTVFDASTNERIMREVKPCGWIQPQGGKIGVYNVQGIEPYGLFNAVTGNFN